VLRAFYVVGPTACGKSELAADVAVRLGAEIVNADAFQIYEGFDVLTGKPDSRVLARAPHHLIGIVSPAEEMNAAKYRSLAIRVISDITSRGKMALIVGGSGLYLKALTHGLVDAPPADVQLREQLNKLSTEKLRTRLTELDPATAERIDFKNRRRLVRAVELCLLTGSPASARRTQWMDSRSGDLQIAELTDSRRSGDRRSLMSAAKALAGYSGVFIFRDRADLYERINVRVEAMLRNGAIDEGRDTGSVGATAEKMIGLREIREHLRGEISLAECTAKIQQSTRQYAKRQLTWFRRQTIFESLNLSLLSHDEAVEGVLRRALARRAADDRNA
jgi:tRNA dimethylallyltransferase